MADGLTVHQVIKIIETVSRGPMGALCLRRTTTQMRPRNLRKTFGAVLLNKDEFCPQVLTHLSGRIAFS